MTTSVDPALEHEIGTDGLLQIRLHDGDARLQAVSGTTVRVRDRGGDVTRAVDAECAPGSLAIRAGRSGIFGEGRRRGRHALDLDVDVPVGATVVIETASGDIRVSGLRGDQRYRSASGDITLRDVSGRLDADSVSGDLEILAVGQSAIKVRTVSGDVSLRAATITALSVSTTSGDVRLAAGLAGTGPFAIETVSGDSVLALAGDVRVELRTVAGDLRSDVPAVADGGPGRRTLTVGRGGPTLAVRSMSGDVRLVHPTAVSHEEVPSMSDDAPTLVVATDPADADTLEAARLAILRDLEDGAIDVAEALLRLEAVDIRDEPDRTPADG